MKKIYISICALAISASSIAQVATQSFTNAKGVNSHKVSLLNAEKSAPFWSEDFSNGIPTTWTNSTVPWVYRGASTIPNNTVGSQGAYASSGDPVASATANNGFIIFDSDFYDNAGNAGAFGTGIYPSPHDGVLMTDEIDMSGYTDITLRFHSYFRTFAGQAFVDFYINGVFDSRVQVHSNLGTNDATTTDAIALTRVPFSVVGNTNVKMSFVFEGSTNLVSGFSGYYFWQIDDLELMETPAYLMSVTDQNHGGWDIGYASTIGTGMDYTFKPLLQSDANPYMFEMTLVNAGASPIHGIQMNIDVADGNGISVFNSNSDSTTLAILDTASYLASQTFTPSSVGVYQMSFWGTADSIPSSDTTFMSAFITDTVYGRDNNNPGSDWRVGRSCGGLQLGNKFDIYADDELTSVSAYIADYSVVGTDVFGILYEVDTSGGSSSYVFLDQTDDYSLQSSDIDNWVTIGFNQALNVYSGQQYMLCIGGYAHPVDTFGVNVSGDAEVTMSMIMDDGNGCALGSATTFPAWYWISETPMIRMNFGETLVNSIYDNAFSGALSVYPNPSNGKITLEMNEVNNDRYNVTINNLIGQTVYSFEKEINGFYKEDIDISTFGKGTYLITISNSSTAITEKLIVE